MAPTKILPRISSGVPKPSPTHSQCSQNIAKPSTLNAKLAKAKSSPNVSKPPLYQSIKVEGSSVGLQNRNITSASKQPSPQNKQTRLADPIDPRNHITIVKVQGTPQIRQKISKKPLIATKSDQGKRADDESCTILEDRALLKKGLTSQPPKMPKKLDTMRKKSLNRSTSLWSVRADLETGANKKRASTGTIEPKKDTKADDKNPGNLNRASSLWNVPGNISTKMSRAKSINTLKPSRIPLLTHNFCSQSNLGQSLGNLSLVDRSSEKIQPRIIDFYEVDHAPADHIYQNCHEATAATLNDSPIYENSKKELIRTKSVPIVTFPGARDAEVMIEDEDDKIVKPTRRNSRIDLEACRVSLERSKDLLSQSRENLDRSKEELAKSREELARSKENVSRSHEILDQTRNFAKSQDSLFSRRESEVNIREIRKNWENQMKRCQNPEDSELSKSRSRLNVKKTAEKDVPVKRAKDIEHLVNFFNCKNTKASKEIIQESWKVKESPITIISRKEEKANGYSSDGNCSEDSGHISNENDVEWKEDHLDQKNLVKTENFLTGIIHDLDTSIERTIQVFDSTPIVQRYVPEETKAKRNLKSSLSTSSDASSTDSWDETGKIKRTNKITTNENTRDQVKIIGIMGYRTKVVGRFVVFMENIYNRRPSRSGLLF